MRKRLQLVRHRTSHILSIKNILSRNLGTTMKSDAIKRLKDEEVKTLFPEPHLYLSVMASLTTVQHLTSQVGQIEKTLLGQIRLRDDFKGLLTVPGIGIILGLTIMLEVGDIRRFEAVGNLCLLLQVRPERASLERQEDG